AIHFADVLLQNIELGKRMDDAGAGNAYRDQLMADNAMWILQQEQARGNQCIFLSGHNGHMEQFGSYGENSKVMGNLLADQLGDDYFVIGTDFYKTSCNLPKGADRKRINHTFYSYDPLAKASKKCGFADSYLDFSTIPEGSALKAQATDYTWMGALGDGYSPLIMRILPASYRVWRSPSERFDAIIFVSDAHPTEIKEMSTAALDNLVTAIRQAEPQNKEDGDSEEEPWKAALAEDLLEKYGVLPEYYVDLGEGIYQVYVEVGGEVVPFITVDSATGDYHG
ncbi:MAG: erythromycin esterase family protein, partial [Firmicutes bacterium]|nr:erythromycin esterase family protein [Bacillota bacterium]